MSARQIILLVSLFLLTNRLGSAREIAIVGATVIDGTGRAPIPNATLIIGEDGKIRQVGAGIAAPAGAEVVNAQGKYLIPGLWDMHVHYRGWVPELFLHFGVTTIQDVGNLAEWIVAQRDGIAKGKIVGPRILACGDTIGSLKEAAEVRIHAHYLASSEDAHRVAQEQIAKGVDCLKAHSFITPEQTKAVAEEAQRVGKPVVGHATTANNAVMAAEAGIKQLAHLQGVAEASLKDPHLVDKLKEEAAQDAGKASSDEDQKIMNVMNSGREWLFIDPQKEKEVLQFLLKKGVFIEPDIANRAIHGGLPREMVEEWSLEDSLLFQDPNMQFIPPYYQARVLKGWWALTRLSPTQQEEVEKRYHNAENFIKDYVQAGGKVLTGSDSASEGVPGISLQRELQLLVRAGLTPLQVIQASSYNAALFYHKENELGSLQPGRYADLLILDADPLADIRNTRKIAAVYKEGKLIDTTFHANFSNPIPEPYGTAEQMHANPRPMLQGKGISPRVATQGDSAREITLRGSGFIRGTLAYFDGQSVPTKWVSATEMKMMVPGELLIRAGTFPIYVANPFPVMIYDPLHEDERSNVLYFIVRFK